MKQNDFQIKIELRKRRGKVIAQFDTEASVSVPFSDHEEAMRIYLAEVERLKLEALAITKK